MNNPDPRIFKKITRRNLDNYIASDLWDGHSARANIRIIEIEGMPFVLKDFGGKGALARAGLARLLIGHEWRIYKKLEGLFGIPRVYHRVDPEAFIMEYVPGKPLKDFNHDLVSPAFMRNLEALVHAMHKRGVVHFDLHQRRNIIVTDDDLAYLVDFATAVNFGQSAFAQEVLVPLFGKFDLSGVLKVKKWHAPDCMDDRERKFLRRMEKMRRLWVFTPIHVSKRKPPCPQARNLTQENS